MRHATKAQFAYRSKFMGFGGQWQIRKDEPRCDPYDDRDFEHNWSVIMRDEENDRPAWGKKDPLEMESKMDNFAIAQRSYDRQEPEYPQAPLEATLADRIVDWMHGSTETARIDRMYDLADFLIDEFNLGQYDDPLKTLQEWMSKGTKG